jgi:hypothetical protein
VILYTISPYSVSKLQLFATFLNFLKKRLAFSFHMWYKHHKETKVPRRERRARHVPAAGEKGSSPPHPVYVTGLHTQ